MEGEEREMLLIINNYKMYNLNVMQFDILFALFYVNSMSYIKVNKWTMIIYNHLDSYIFHSIKDNNDLDILIFFVSNL